MLCRVMYFGITRDFSKKKEEKIEMEASSQLKDLHDLLKNKVPQLKELRSYRLAINETFAEDESIELKDGDVVAVIPPVSGG